MKVSLCSINIYLVLMVFATGVNSYFRVGKRNVVDTGNSGRDIDVKSIILEPVVFGGARSLRELMKKVNNRNKRMMMKREEGMRNKKRLFDQEVIRSQGNTYQLLDPSPLQPSYANMNNYINDEFLNHQQILVDVSGPISLENNLPSDSIGQDPYYHKLRRREAKNHQQQQQQKTLLETMLEEKIVDGEENLKHQKKQKPNLLESIINPILVASSNQPVNQESKEDLPMFVMEDYENKKKEINNLHHLFSTRTVTITSEEIIE